MVVNIPEIPLIYFLRAMTNKIAKISRVTSPVTKSVLKVKKVIGNSTIPSPFSLSFDFYKIL